MSGRVIAYKWSDYYEYWYACRDTGWRYNTHRTSKLVVYAWLGALYDRRCGPDYYGADAQGSVWHDGAWRTTLRVWSGYAYYY